MAKPTTIFIEYKEEVLPKLIPAVIDSIWYPKPEEEEETDEPVEEPVVEEPVI